MDAYEYMLKTASEMDQAVDDMNRKKKRKLSETEKMELKSYRDSVDGHQRKSNMVAGALGAGVYTGARGAGVAKHNIENPKNPIKFKKRHVGGALAVGGASHMVNNVMHAKDTRRAKRDAKRQILERHSEY